MASDVSREEFTEVQIEQALLRQSIDTIAQNTTKITESVQSFVTIANRLEGLVERVETVHARVAIHETELAVMRSHDIVNKVNGHDRDMPGLREVRGWVIRGVLAIVGSVLLAALAVILH